LLPDYLSLYANSLRGRAYIRSRAKSSSGLNTINSTVVKEFPVPVTDVECQNALVEQAHQFDLSLYSIANNQRHLNEMLKEFLNSIFA
jgi:restriction endonuclease S subunit